MPSADTLKPPAPVRPSPVQVLIAAQQQQQEEEEQTHSHPAALHSLATQIAHNLAHQHAWRDVAVHTHSPLTHAPLLRPLLAGTPPQRLYIHPDEQVELLRAADRARKARGDGAGALEVRARPEREWVVPTRVGEKWTLRRVAEVFDGVGVVPPEGEGGEEVERTNKWRTTKRVVLASVDTDSTVTYYIVHEGVVKPRQN